MAITLTSFATPLSSTLAHRSCGAVKYVQFSLSIVRPFIGLRLAISHYLLCLGPLAIFAATEHSRARAPARAQRMHTFVLGSTARRSGWIGSPHSRQMPYSPRFARDKACSISLTRFLLCTSNARFISQRVVAGSPWPGPLSGLSSRASSSLAICSCCLSSSSCNAACFFSHRFLLYKRKKPGPPPPTPSGLGTNQACTSAVICTVGNCDETPGNPGNDLARVCDTGGLYNLLREWFFRCLV